MDLMERIRLLREYGMMDETAFEDILAIMKLFKEEYGIELTEENAGIMITHMSSAFHRNVTGEEIDAMDACILEEIKEVPEYVRAERILVSIASGIKNDLSKKEMEYFLVHICNLLANTN